MLIAVVILTDAVPEARVAKGVPDTEDGRVLLYYCYTDVTNPEALRAWQFRLCKALGLRGRIHVSKEGINGWWRARVCVCACVRVLFQGFFMCAQLSCNLK